MRIVKSRYDVFFLLFIVLVAMVCLPLNIAHPSIVAGLFNVPSVHATGMSTSLIGNLESVVSAVNYTSDIDAAYQGMIVGETSVRQLISAYNALTNPTTVLQWTPILSKLGYVNQTTIEWALDNQQIMSDGLPNTGTDSLSGASQSFLVYDRFLILAYGYAVQYNYDLAKWNLTKAYNSFKASVDSATYPALLYVDQNGAATWISYGPRYYDECGETIDCFLDFYNLGMTTALNDSLATWLWANNNLWSGTHYNYARNWVGYECEAGGFLQIALKLWHADSSLPDTQRLLGDIENRFLQEQWLSPQWTTTLGGASSYVVVHMATGNPQLRLENTVMAWAAILGSYGELNSTYQSDVQSMLTGTNSAWLELLQSPLCGSHFPDFLEQSDNSGPSNDATATGADLLFMLGIVPQTAVLAVPVEENLYEYIHNIFDPGLFNINMTTHIVTVSLATSGTINFQFNSTVTGTFGQAGVYTVQFSPNWNTIVSATLVAPLPTNRQYMYTTPATSPTRACLVVRGDDNRIYYCIYNSTTASWSGWNSLPTGTTMDSPAATVVSDKVYVVVRGMDSTSLWFSSVNLTDNSFSGWSLLSGSTPSAPTLTSNSTTLALVVQGDDNRIYCRFFTIAAQTWTEWSALPSGATLDSPAASLAGNVLHIVVRGTEGSTLWYSNVNQSIGVFSGWTLLSGSTPSAPTLATNGTTLALVVHGGDNRIYYCFYIIATQTWTDWSALPSGTTQDSPAATILGSTLCIGVVGYDGNSLWTSNVDLGTSAFSSWTLLSGATQSSPTLTS